MSLLLIPEQIFPESEMPLIWEPIAAAEEKFELLTLRNDADHTIIGRCGSGSRI